jgi:hypothetical protein
MRRSAIAFGWKRKYSPDLRDTARLPGERRQRHGFRGRLRRRLLEEQVASGIEDGGRHRHMRRHRRDNDRGLAGCEPRPDALGNRQPRRGCQGHIGVVDHHRRANPPQRREMHASEGAAADQQQPGVCPCRRVGRQREGPSSGLTGARLHRGIPRCRRIR